VSFLARLLGAPQFIHVEEKRFRANLKKLEEREKELDRLSEQIDDVEEAARSKQDKLTVSAISLNTALARSLTPPSMQAVKKDPDEQDDERVSGELTPAGAHGR